MSPPPDPKQASRQPGREPDQVDFIARHEWTIVGALAVVAFVMGCFGFAETLTFAEEGGSYTRWDVVYSAFRMFIFEAPDESAGWPLYLQVARALAPMVVLYAAAKAVWNPQAPLHRGLRHR